ncbi:MAG TPA: nucleotidyltransferase domain-containing protein [Rhodospirillales bacterium]|nr:nucleotidyltransferase domain-containing protein [Rhodospirillales bacterium]
MGAVPQPDAKERARVAEVARAVATLAREWLGPGTQVWWFGSWPEGRARPRSDIDIAILPPPDVSVERVATFRAAVDELPTLYRVDLVDLREVSEEFRARILRRGRPL